jgi:hypothetical protein
MVSKVGMDNTYTLPKGALTRVEAKMEWPDDLRELLLEAQTKSCLARVKRG